MSGGGDQESDQPDYSTVELHAQSFSVIAASIPKKVQRGLNVYPVRIICVASSLTWIVFGAFLKPLQLVDLFIEPHCGAIFLFNRTSKKTTKLKLQEQLLCLKLLSSDYDYIAAALCNCKVTVYRLPSSKTGQDRKLKEYLIESHQHRVTALEWNQDGKILITGDKSGVVVMNCLDFDSDTFTSCFVCAENSPIIQISFCPDSNLVAVSSEYRASLVDLNKNYTSLLNNDDSEEVDNSERVIQVGSTPRKILSDYGVKLVSEIEFNNEPTVVENSDTESSEDMENAQGAPLATSIKTSCLTCRPGLRLWKVDVVNGTVLETLIYKDLILSAPVLNYVAEDYICVDYDFDWSEFSGQFGTLLHISPHLFLTYSSRNSNHLFVLDTKENKIRLKVRFKSPIIGCDVITSEKLKDDRFEIFTLCEPMNLIRISNFKSNEAELSSQRRSSLDNGEKLPPKHKIFSSVFGRVRSAARNVWQGLDDGLSVTTFDTVDTWSSVSSLESQNSQANPRLQPSGILHGTGALRNSVNSVSMTRLSEEESVEDDHRREASGSITSSPKIVYHGFTYNRRSHQRNDSDSNDGSTKSMADQISETLSSIANDAGELVERVATYGWDVGPGGIPTGRLSPTKQQATSEGAESEVVIHRKERIWKKKGKPLPNLVRYQNYDATDSTAPVAFDTKHVVDDIITPSKEQFPNRRFNPFGESTTTQSDNGEESEEQRSPKSVQVDDASNDAMEAVESGLGSSDDINVYSQVAQKTVLDSPASKIESLEQFLNQPNLIQSGDTRDFLENFLDSDILGPEFSNLPRDFNDDGSSSLGGDVEPEKASDVGLTEIEQQSTNTDAVEEKSPEQSDVGIHTDDVEEEDTSDHHSEKVYTNFDADHPNAGQPLEPVIFVTTTQSDDSTSSISVPPILRIAEPKEKKENDFISLLKDKVQSTQKHLSTSSFLTHDPIRNKPGSLGTTTSADDESVAINPFKPRAPRYPKQRLFSSPDDGIDDVSEASQRRATNTSVDAKESPSKLPISPYEIDVWSSYKTDYCIASLSGCKNYTAYVDAKQFVWYTSSSDVELRWSPIQEKADSIHISPNGKIVWRLLNGIAYALVRPHSRKPKGQKWVEAATTVISIAVTNSEAWYIKTDGQAYVQTKLSSDRPCGVVETVPPPRKMVYVACSSQGIWGLTDEGTIVVRVGLSSACTVGRDWIEIEPEVSTRFVDLCMWEETCWAVDVDGQLWFMTGISHRLPVGYSAGKWWQVMIPSETERATGQLLFGVLVASYQSVPRVYACHNAVWLAIGQRLIVTRSSLSGHRWKCPLPRDLARISSFISLSAGTLHDQYRDLVWLLRSNHEILAVQPKTKTVQSMPSCSSNAVSLSLISAAGSVLWALDSDGNIHVRMKIDQSSCPVGLHWITLDLTQLGGAKLVHLCCSLESVWACDKEGLVYMRIGSDVATHTPLMAAWVPIYDQKPLRQSVTAISVSYCGSTVWVLTKGGKPYARMRLSSENPIGDCWAEVEGLECRAIAVGTDVAFAISIEGFVYRRYHLSLKNPTGDYWKKIPGQLTSISVSPHNQLWGLDDRGTVMQRSVKLYRGMTLSVDSELDWEVL